MSSTGTAIQAGLVGPDTRSILDESPVRMPTAGKIRPGIMVLTAAGKALAGAQQIYDSGVAQGWSWDAIERAIKAKHPDVQKSPLTPKNTAYFTVFPHDFKPEASAALIMERYGEVREDGIRRLYSFPIVFAVDQLQHVLPHALRAYRASELVYRSDFDEEGNRLCLTHEPVEVDPKSKRAILPFGGRRWMPRPDNGGICDPEACREFQEGKCKLTGSLVGYIPDVPGAGMVSIPTTSIYGLKAIRDKLVVVRHLRGRISGLIDGKAIFWLSKQEQEVPMIDRLSGQVKKVRQWMPVLEERIDVFKIMAAQETVPALAAGSQAAAMLSGPEKAEAAPAPVEPTPAELRAEIEKRLEALRIHKATFKAYATSVYPQGWRDDAKTLGSLIDVLECVPEQPELRQVIEAFAKDDAL